MEKHILFVIKFSKQLALPFFSLASSTNNISKEMGKSSSSEESEVKKGPWTPEEDEKLVSYIHAHGPGKWRTLPKNAGKLLPL